jgi:hypothetical protein
MKQTSVTSAVQGGGKRRLKTVSSNGIEYYYSGVQREVIMRIHFVPPMFSFALLIGIAALPATACELEQKAASHRTVTAFLTEHGRAATSTPLPQLVACKADGSACAADAECCSGACKPIGEGRACVSK